MPFSYPGFVPAFIRDSFCEGRGPFRWVALSGDADIAATDQALRNLCRRPAAERMAQLRPQADRFSRAPARICWLGYRERDRAGLLFNQMVRDGRLKAPIVIGRDHLDAGSVASPFRETEGMLDGSDAVSDWALLIRDRYRQRSRVDEFHHGGGVGMGYSQHAGLVAVTRRQRRGHERLRMCLTNDPATGVIRHADAGYELAKTAAKERGPGYARRFCFMKEDLLLTGISQLVTAERRGGESAGATCARVKLMEGAAIAIYFRPHRWTGKRA